MITNEKHLLHILGIDKNQLNDILVHIDDYYYSFERIKYNKFTDKPKKESNGQIAKRTINSSSGILKTIQQRLYKYILNHVDIPEYAYGGVKGKNNILNARYHQGNKYIFTTDLKSFFPSISNQQVFKMFLREGCTPTIASILTKITTRKHQVPQGIPTSTLIANLVFRPTGDKIFSLAKNNNIKFSMFVDDITLSSNTDFKHLTLEFISIIQQDGFKISHKKTHYQTKNPTVTGVICQNNRILAPLGYKKKLAILKKKYTSGDESVKNKIDGISLYIDGIGKTNVE